jgi:predicted RNA binding protein YcfA (HicA-like mRNA interferase family)
MHLHDIERQLRQAGWYLHRVRGSHRHYRNDGPPQARLTLSVHGGRHTPVSPYQVARMEQDLRRLEAAVSA